MAQQHIGSTHTSTTTFDAGSQAFKPKKIPVVFHRSISLPFSLHWHSIYILYFPTGEVKTCMKANAHMHTHTRSVLYAPTITHTLLLYWLDAHRILQDLIPIPDLTLWLPSYTVHCVSRLMGNMLLFNAFHHTIAKEWWVTLRIEGLHHESN